MKYFFWYKAEARVTDQTEIFETRYVHFAANPASNHFVKSMIPPTADKI